MITKIVLSEEYLAKKFGKINDLINEIIDADRTGDYRHTDIEGMASEVNDIIDDIDNECAYFDDILIDLPLLITDIVMINGVMDKIIIDEKELDKSYGFI